MTRLLVWLLAGWMVLPALGRPGVVRRVDGATLRGDVQFGTEGLVLRPEEGESVNLSLAEVVELSFDVTDTDAATPKGAAAGEGAVTPAPATGEWAGVPIGTERPGEVAAEGTLWRVTGGGTGLQGNGDSCFLAQQPLEVSGQILAKLESLEGEGIGPDAMAGLTLRDNLGEASAYAFVGFRRSTGVCFQYRQIASGMTMRVTNVVHDLPAWLRLSRVGGAIVAEMSGDGRQWRVLGRANVNLGRTVRAGMVVAGGTNDAVVTAGFRQPVAGVRGLGYVPESGFPRLRYRGGSTLVSPIQSADESVVRLGGPWRGSLVSVLNLARIEFVPVAEEVEARLDAARPGLLLVDGDFLDGNLRSITTNTVLMSSLLFGFRPFVAGSEAAAIQLGSVESTDAVWVVELDEGSEVRADELGLRPDGLRAEGGRLGRLDVPLERIRRVRRMSGDR